MSKEDAIHVVPAVYNTPMSMVVPGSTKGVCSICAAEVWMAPSAPIVLSEHPNARKVCLECAHEQGYLKNCRMANMTPEQRDEIEKMHGKEVADRMFRQFG